MTLDAHTHFELVESNSNFVFYQTNTNQSEFTYYSNNLYGYINIPHWQSDIRTNTYFSFLLILTPWHRMFSYSLVFQQLESGNMQKKEKDMNIWNCDICVWHPPTFDICHNFFFKRNYVLKQVPTHLLVQCHKIRSFFLKASLINFTIFTWNERNSLQGGKKYLCKCLLDEAWPQGRVGTCQEQEQHWSWSCSKFPLVEEELSHTQT